jgi:hypothetical protein
MSLPDIQVFAIGMDEVELALRVLLVQVAIALHSGLAIWAGLDHGYAVNRALLRLGMRLQGLNDKPLSRVFVSNTKPTHESLLVH